MGVWDADGNARFARGTVRKAIYRTGACPAALIALALPCAAQAQAVPPASVPTREEIQRPALPI